MINKKIEILSKKDYLIETQMYIPDNANKIIIAIHGFGGDKSSSVIVALANELNKYNIGVVCFDFPGHGESKVDGNFYTVENSINDLNSVEEYLKKEFNLPIGIFATSYGGYIALLNMTKNNKKYCNVILRCPAINMYEIFKNSILTITDEEFKEKGYCELGYERKINITYEYYQELKNNDLKTCIQNLENNVVIIHGTEDDLAPIKDSEELERKFPEFVKLERVYGADHRFKKPGELEKILEISKKYLV